VCNGSCINVTLVCPSLVSEFHSNLVVYFISTTFRIVSPEMNDEITDMSQLPALMFLFLSLVSQFFEVFN